MWKWRGRAGREGGRGFFPVCLSVCLSGLPVYMYVCVSACPSVWSVWSGLVWSVWSVYLHVVCCCCCCFMSTCAHTHARAHAPTHPHTHQHTRTHTHTHARKPPPLHTHTHTHTPLNKMGILKNDRAQYMEHVYLLYRYTCVCVCVCRPYRRDRDLHCFTPTGEDVHYKVGWVCVLVCGCVCWCGGGGDWVRCVVCDDVWCVVIVSLSLSLSLSLPFCLSLLKRLRLVGGLDLRCVGAWGGRLYSGG